MSDDEDRVVCVEKAVNLEDGYRGPVPVVGRIYTICNTFKILRHTYYYLIEMDRWFGWHERLFRPVKKVKTDISIFTSLLSPSSPPTTTPIKVLEDA